MEENIKKDNKEDKDRKEEDMVIIEDGTLSSFGINRDTYKPEK